MYGSLQVIIMSITKIKRDKMFLLIKNIISNSGQNLFKKEIFFMNFNYFTDSIVS